MPTTPYAKLRASINGGAVQTGGITASVGDTVQLSFESTVGWQSSSRTEFAPPDGMALPSGWSSEVEDGHTTYYVLGNTPPPIFTLGPWGKYMFRLLVNGGGGDKTDETLAIDILSPNGLHDLGYREADQFGGAAEKWVKHQQENLRTLDSATSGGVPTTRTITAGAGLTGGGDLSSNRTLDVVANGDGSIVVNANDVQVGVISDAQHGTRGGGATHAVAGGGVAGFISGANQAKLDVVTLPFLRINPGGSYAAQDGDVILADTSAGDSVTLPLDINTYSRGVTVIGIPSGTGCVVTRGGSDTILGANTNTVNAGQAKCYVGTGIGIWAVFTGAC